MRKAIPFVLALLAVLAGAWFAASYGRSGSKPRPIQQVRQGTEAAGVEQLTAALTKSDQGQGEVEVSTIYIAPKLQRLLESSAGLTGEEKSFARSVKLAPPAQRQLAFAVFMNTHSVSLKGYDPAKIAYLLNDRGNRMRPAAWKRYGNEEHHISGLLLFENTNSSFVWSRTNSLRLVLTGLAGVKQRVFEFQAPGRYL